MRFNLINPTRTSVWNVTRVGKLKLPYHVNWHLIMFNVPKLRDLPQYLIQRTIQAKRMGPIKLPTR